MIGALVAALGAVFIVLALAWLFGPLVLFGAGGVLIVAGLFVDFDRVKEPQRAKRYSAAP